MTVPDILNLRTLTEKQTEKNDQDQNSPADPLAGADHAGAARTFLLYSSLPLGWPVLILHIAFAGRPRSPFFRAEANAGDRTCAYARVTYVTIMDRACQNCVWSVHGEMPRQRVH